MANIFKLAEGLGVSYPVSDKTTVVLQVHPEFASLMWTTLLGAQQTYLTIEEFLPDAPKDHETAVFLRYPTEGHIVTSGHEAVQALREDENQIRFWRIDWEQFSFLWRASSRLDKPGSSDANDCGVVAEQIDADMFSNLFVQTAPDVSTDTATDLIQEIAEVHPDFIKTDGGLQT
jgi:hypothetical protein